MNTQAHTDSTQTSFLNKYLVPNFYERCHFDACEGWSDDKWEAFKKYVIKGICATDWVKEGLEEMREEFEEEWQEEEEKEKE